MEGNFNLNPISHVIPETVLSRPLKMACKVVITTIDDVGGNVAFLICNKYLKLILLSANLLLIPLKLQVMVQCLFVFLKIHCRLI